MAGVEQRWVWENEGQKQTFLFGGELNPGLSRAGKKCSWQAKILTTILPKMFHDTNSCASTIATKLRLDSAKSGMFSTRNQRKIIESGCLNRKGDSNRDICPAYLWSSRVRRRWYTKTTHKRGGKWVGNLKKVNKLNTSTPDSHMHFGYEPAAFLTHWVIPGATDFSLLVMFLDTNANSLQHSKQYQIEEYICYIWWTVDLLVTPCYCNITFRLSRKSINYYSSYYPFNFPESSNEEIKARKAYPPKVSIGCRNLWICRKRPLSMIKSVWVLKT